MEIIKKIMHFEKDADNFGFRWERAEQILSQIQSECAEIDVHLKDKDKEKLQNEVGDLMHAVFSLCSFLKLDPVETLEKSVDKFQRRLSAVKKITAEAGLRTLNGQSFEALMAIWDQAKNEVG